MPIELPKLDDKTYAELVLEARAAIPGIYPGWTDHNPSDPGIALVELFAWLSEMLIYRAGRIPDESVRTFLRVLDGGAPLTPLPLDEAIRATVGTLRERFRAVTTDDFEHLATYTWPGWAAEHAEQLESWDITLDPPEIPPTRVRCIAERDLEADPDEPAPGHMSLIVAPAVGAGTAPWLAPSLALRAGLGRFFDERRLVTTRVHVVGPTYVGIEITATLRLKNDARAADEGGVPGVATLAAEALFEHFHPWTGRGGAGWPFGRSVYRSEIFALLDGVRGVEEVYSATIAAPNAPASQIELDGSTVVAIHLGPHELPRLAEGDIELEALEAPVAGWEGVP